MRTGLKTFVVSGLMVLGLVGASIASAPAAQEGTRIVLASDFAAIEKAIRARDVEPERTVQDGQALFEWEEDGVSFSVLTLPRGTGTEASGEETPDNLYMQAILPMDKPDLALLNEINLAARWVRVYWTDIDDTPGVRFEWDLQVNPGVSEASLGLAIGMWRARTLEAASDLGEQLLTQDFEKMEKAVTDKTRFSDKGLTLETVSGWLKEIGIDATVDDEAGAVLWESGEMEFALSLFGDETEEGMAGDGAPFSFYVRGAMAIDEADFEKVNDANASALYIRHYVSEGDGGGAALVVEYDHPVVGGGTKGSFLGALGNFLGFANEAITNFSAQD